MEDELFLGKVLKNEMTWARMEPLAVRRDGRWIEIDDTIQMFPSEGKVFSKRPLLNAPLNSLWTFKRRTNERREGADLLLAEEIVKATPLVDLSEMSVEQARQRLFGQGVDLKIEGNSSTAVVLLSDDMFCEITLSRSADGLWKANPVFRNVSLREAPQTWNGVRPFEGLRVLPSQSIPLAPIIESVNWCSDQDFVERVIERFRKFTQHVGDTSYARPSKESVKYIARALQQADLMPGDENDVELNLERLEAQWPILEARFEASESLSALLLGLKANKDKISAAAESAAQHAMEAARPEFERKVREEVEVTLAQMLSRRDELSLEVDSLAQRRVVVAQELTELENQCAEGRKERQILSDNLRSVAGDLRAGNAHGSHQEQAAFKLVAERIEGALEQSGYRGPGLIPSPVPSWGLPAMDVGTRDIQRDALQARFAEEAELHAVEKDSLRLIDVFSRAGELVLICGTQAELALRAYARCVTGGAYRTMALDPSIIGLDDLWRAPGTQAPTVLANAWHTAVCEPDSLHIVCLRNLDAAPFSLWLASLQAVLSSNSRPKNLLVLATTTAREEAHSAGVASDHRVGEYLVPVCPGVHEQGSTSVLGSIVSPVMPPSRVRLSLEDAPADSTTNGWLARISSMKTGPHSLSRLARLGDALTGADADAMMESLHEWGRFLFLPDQTKLPSCIKDGYAVLNKLLYQS
ncbi:hypothetical protein PQR67_35705 [Paraburkholderia fungorum]|uniref:hypothetical protein n=1 Tax=Paraburkholderia fungorum TaxID=134537 RepID=UPI0038BE0D4C